MITFLRKIRRSLIQSGSARKYILYAIGEIALVVIGILIALQINNWNQNRVERKTEKIVLLKLMNDLEGDFTRFQTIDSFSIQYISQLVKQRDIIYQAEINNSQLKEVINYGGASFPELNPRRTTYDEMIFSGKIYSLRNDNLVEEIIEYYRTIDKLIYQNRQERNEFRALFYGPGLTDFWSFQADPKYREKLALRFFNNQNTQAYKLMKQSAGWSVVINQRLKIQVENLIKQNRQLKYNVDEYISIIN